MVAAEEDGKGIGRIRLRQVVDLTRATLHGFIAQSIDLGSTVRTDGLNAYLEMVRAMSTIGKLAASAARRRTSPAPSASSGIAAETLAAGHFIREPSVTSIWIIISTNSRFASTVCKSRNRGKLFDRLVQQAVQVVAGPIRFIAQTTIPSGRWSQAAYPYLISAYD